MRIKLIVLPKFYITFEVLLFEEAICIHPLGNNLYIFQFLSSWVHFRGNRENRRSVFFIAIRHRLEENYMLFRCYSH